MTTTRSKALMIRLTKQEKDTLSEAARRAGLGIGPWLRMLGLNAAKAPRWAHLPDGSTIVASPELAPVVLKRSDRPKPR